MLELTIDNQLIKLNKPEELPTYLEIADRFGHKVAQTLITKKIKDPMGLLNNDLLWFDASNDNSISQVNGILYGLRLNSFADILLHMAGITTDRVHEMLTQSISVIESLMMIDYMIDYEATRQSFAAPMNADTNIYLRNADLKLLEIPIKSLLMIKITDAHS